MQNYRTFQGDVEDDSNVPDRVEDIRPRFHRARTQGLGASAHAPEDPSELASLGVAPAQQQQQKQDSDEEDEVEGGEADETSTEWNLSERLIFYFFELKLLF